MTLRELLNTYESISKVYIEHYVDDKTSKKRELFRSLDLLPENYLNCNITRWEHKIECGVLGTNRFGITPIVVIDSEGLL
jgi:hypothetical protein